MQWKTRVAREYCIGTGRGGCACHFVSATVIGPGGRARGGGEGGGCRVVFWGRGACVGVGVEIFEKARARVEKIFRFR